MAYRIIGENALCGTVTVGGSKNAVLPILFASVLVGEPVTLYGVPDIIDVRKTLSLLSQMGADVKREGGMLTVCCQSLSPPDPCAEEIAALRASSYLLGAGLSRFGEISMAYPGGCNFGVRPLDIHRGALCALGAEWQEDERGISVSKTHLKGCEICLSYASVGATVNALLAALSAEGETVLRGFADGQNCNMRFCPFH